MRSHSDLRLPASFAARLTHPQEDGSLWEDTLDYHMVRPMPPERPEAFADSLRKGVPLEIFHRDGWWDVEFVRNDGPQYLVETKRYAVQHKVPLSQLRPAWKWEEKARQWSVHERLPAPKEKGAPPRATPKPQKNAKKR